MYFVLIGYNDNDLYLNRYFDLVLMNLIVFRPKVTALLWIYLIDHGYLELIIDNLSARIDISDMTEW